MKITWLDLNASYSHSSLALPAIHAQHADEQAHQWESIHTTINQPLAPVLQQLIESKPDIVCATAWLFTHDQLHKILSRFKQLLPACTIALGGPEFLGDNEAYLRNHRYVDVVFRGEGEIVFHQWLTQFHQKETWTSIDGLCYIDSTNQYQDNGMARVMAFNQLKTPEESRFFQKERPFVQLETTRGCFNTCAFCVSGSDKPVRALDISTIRKRLHTYHQMGIQSIRMLDRTFNAQQQRAIDLLSLFEEFNGMLTFHLEVHPAFLNSAVREKIAQMPAGLLHIEAGIQSLNETVLQKSTRLGSLAHSLDGLRFLSSLDNVETHADLIAGLPDYTLQMIIEDVYTLSDIGTDEIQLESLKLLPGTVMRQQAEKWGIAYAPNPPYEVLQSNAMSFEELEQAMQISRILDMYYNSAHWQDVFRLCLKNHRDFLTDLCHYMAAQQLFDNPLSLERKGFVLIDFCKSHYIDMTELVIKSWILAGLSTQKLKENIQDYKHQEAPSDATNIKGVFDPQNRNYQWRNFFWGYDRAKERQKPVYFAQKA